MIFLIALQYQVLGVSNDLPNKCNFLDLCYESEFTRGFLEIEMNLWSYSSGCNSKIVCRIFWTKINSNIFVLLLSISMRPLSPLKSLRCLLIEFPSPYLSDSNSQCCVIVVVSSSQLRLREFQQTYVSTKQTSQLRLCEFQNPYFRQNGFTTEMKIYDLLWFLQRYCFTLAILPCCGNSKCAGKT